MDALLQAKREGKQANPEWRLARWQKQWPEIYVQSGEKSEFGIAMSYDMASTYKSAALKQLRGKRRGPKPGRKPAALAPTTNGRAAGAISIEDIQAVKDLADKIGAEKVGQLAAVLAK